MVTRAGPGPSFAAAFGARLRSLRDQRGWTQANLAEAVGAYASQISKYESGEVMPEGETLAALADALDVSLDELVLGRTAANCQDVPHARLHASIRELERLGDPQSIEVAATLIEALTTQVRQSTMAMRSYRRS